MNAYDLKTRLPDDDLVPLRDALREARRGAVRSTFCTECGHWHTTERRLRLLRKLDADGVDDEVIHEAWPCLWPADEGGTRLLRRDRAELRRIP